MMKIYNPDLEIFNNHTGYDEGSKYYKIPDIIEVKNNKTENYTAYYWDNQKRKLLAIIDNARYKDVSTAMQEYSNKWSVDISNLLRQKLPNSQIISYTYQTPFGPTSITEANGLTHYYDYEMDGGRLSEIYLLSSGKKAVIEKFMYRFNTPSIY